MFLNKNWALSGVKTVLSKIDATINVERCSGVVVVVVVVVSSS